MFLHGLTKPMEKISSSIREPREFVVSKSEVLCTSRLLSFSKTSCCVCKLFAKVLSPRTKFWASHLRILPRTEEKSASQCDTKQCMCGVAELQVGRKNNHLLSYQYLVVVTKRSKKTKAKSIRFVRKFKNNSFQSLRTR